MKISRLMAIMWRNRAGSRMRVHEARTPRSPRVRHTMAAPKARPVYSAITVAMARPTTKTKSRMMLRPLMTTWMTSPARAFCRPRYQPRIT
jgi:hypothetical protein